MRNRTAAALVALCALSAHAQKITAVRFARLWDGSKVIDRPLVLIANGRITNVQAGDPAPPAGAEVIDWSRYYGLPGLIDVHTHMTYIGDRPGGVRGGGPRMAAVTVFLAQENARKTLEAGVTPSAISARPSTPISPCGTSSIAAPCPVRACSSPATALP